jgi:hypothetical protein
MPMLKVGNHVVTMTVDELRELMEKEAGRQSPSLSKRVETHVNGAARGEWNPKTVRSYFSTMGPAPKGCAFALSTLNGWTSTKDVAAKAAVKPKGMGSVLNSLLARARGMGLPAPFELDRNREGKNRTTRIRVSDAYRSAAQEVINQTISEGG